MLITYDIIFNKRIMLHVQNLLYLNSTHVLFRSYQLSNADKLKKMFKKMKL